MKIGVLALQGAFREHSEALRALGAEVVEVRLPEHLDGLDGLIIPGGESTTISKLAALYGLDEAIRRFNQDEGQPGIWHLRGHDLRGARRGPPAAGALADRRGRGAQRLWPPDRQLRDRPADARAGRAPFPAVFIRAPLIGEVGPGVQVLARLADGRPVAAQQGRVLVTAFHPELTGDLRIHRYFLEQCAAAREARCGRTSQGE